MPKINVYLADELAEAVKDAGVQVSAVCQRALELAVRRVTAIREVAAGVQQAAGAGGPLDTYFTKRAVAMLKRAQAAAQADGESEIGTGHMLRELLTGQSMAVRVLGALEISAHQITGELARRAGEPDTQRVAIGAPSASEPQLSAQAAAAVELAANESSGLGNGYVGTEHLLLGLIGEPEGEAGHVLRSLGADLRVTRRTVAAALAGWVAHEQRMASQDDGEQAGQLSAAIKTELAPVLVRIERLERLTAS
jgi:ATP-dependent Clp protease ATP-binding subunit ClpA